MGKSVEVTEVFVVFIFQVDRVTVGSPPVLICAINFLKFSYIYRISDAIRYKRQEKPKIIRASLERKPLIGKYGSGRIKLLSS